MNSILIQNGLIVDGTGRKPYMGNVLLKGDRIAAVGDVNQDAERVIDADGKVVCPGFIDIHRHCDAKFLQGPGICKGDAGSGNYHHGHRKLRMSLAPSPAEPEEMYDFMEAVLGAGCACLRYQDFPAVPGGVGRQTVAGQYCVYGRNRFY